jgi:dihydropteroate synthase
LLIVTKFLSIRDRVFHWGQRTYVMGVLNVTPDSFSDGGEFTTVQAAVAQAVEMVTAGVDIIDIGGESTKPGAIAIDVDTELERTIPLLQAIRQHPIACNIPISIDTTKAAVARSAVLAGADIINDISGGNFDPEMLSTVGEMGVPYMMMHMRGTPATMQQLTTYRDLVSEILEFFDHQIERAIGCGIDRDRVILDPGIGFAKTAEQNIELLQHLDRFATLDLPLLVGVSRKSFLGKILNRPEPKERIWGTAAACSAAIALGADILRVHDVPEMIDVCRVTDAIWRTINN